MSMFLEDGEDLLESIRTMNIINEFEADGETSEPDENEEFSMDDEGSDTTTTGETEEDNTPAEDEGDEEYSMDDEGQDQQEENNENEPPEEEGDEDEDYEIPDEDEGNQDDAPADDEGGDEEFSMDDEGEEPTEDEPSSDDMGESSDNTNTKLKDLETVVFDELNDKEKELKIKELKELFIQVHIKCGTISGKVSDLKTDEETIQIAEYISGTLIDLQKYIDDYINNIFDTKTYIENVAHLQKYITIFNAIGKVFNEIRKENVK